MPDLSVGLRVDWGIRLMNKSTNKVATVQFPERCTCPALGELLTDYIVDLLTDSAAQEVEKHLLHCRSCNDDYRKILALRETAQARKTKAGCEEKPSLESAAVLRMSDFKK